MKKLHSLKSLKNKFIIAILFMLAFGQIGCSGSGEVKPHTIITRPEIHEHQLLNKAMKAYDAKAYRTARKLFEQLRDGFPTSPWSVLAKIKAADAIYFSNEDFSEAIAAYEEIRLQHPQHEALPYVRFMLGMSNLQRYQGRSREQGPLKAAMQHFAAVSSEYPNSPYAERSTLLQKKCRKMLAEHELLVAQYYLNQEQYLAAARRLLGIIKNYPDLEMGETAKLALSEHFKNKEDILAKADSSINSINESPSSLPKTMRARLKSSY